MSHQDEPDDSRAEIPILGDITEHESDICDKLLAVPPGGECILYFNSPGGSAYSALSLMSLMVLRGLQAVGVVTGECSSAALWPLAACQRRLVTAHSVLLFHPMKWESGENVMIAEAHEWARHFGHLEVEMDLALARLFGMEPQKMAAWMHPGRYVSGSEFAAAGLGEMLELTQLAELTKNIGAKAAKKRPSRKN